MALSTSEQIRLITRRAGLSLSDIATATGQSRQNLANKLRRDNFTVKDLQAIAAAAGLDLSVQWLDKDGNPVL